MTAATNTADNANIRAAIDEIYRRQSRRVFATLIRLLGAFDLAEEALHDAFRAAVEQWPRDGIPANPVPWLVSAGKFKAIDGIRRSARFTSLDDVAETLASIADEASGADEAKRWKTTACGSFSPAAIRRWHRMPRWRPRYAKCAD